MTCPNHQPRPRAGCVRCFPKPGDTEYRAHFGGEVPARAGSTTGSASRYARRRAATNTKARGSR